MRVEDLVQLEGQGELPELLLFWGHRPPKGGGVGKGCLSQWYPAPFTVDGVRYATAEHFMMVGKARLFGDAEAEKVVLADDDPGKAKGAGRKVRGFDEETWAERRYDLVVAANEAKFGQHPALRDFLLATGDRVLVEASPYDTVWGIGLSASQPEARHPAQWRGLNLLGFALMDVRGSLAGR
ncbi:NADAR family protein [Actinoallomurus purpureus]|uniref:NADAR family protein n=1 Tax=Actinoallomurus purpureus TaxID=478114 RepID=UPI002091EB56|nr:NADAR family protein [Actinoallomurus purpureus]MCO6007654.1 NADAR family protein [Actinoallomurus purpureus]